MTLTFGSLFAGIGGIDLGLERAGMTCKWQVEIDPFCQRVLAKHWPNVARYEDVRTVGKHNLEPVDLICGGFPCQDVSLAGTRKGLEGERSTLWTEYARIVRELSPQWVLAENVPGLFSSDGGRFFGNILRDLASCGYDTEWQVLPAAAFGAPHLRERVFVIANAAGAGNSNGKKRAGWNFSNDLREDVPSPNKQRLAQRERRTFPEGTRSTLDRCDWWAVEPGMGRVANGIPDRVDRLHALGNAVVPQVAEWIGRRILEAV